MSFRVSARPVGFPLRSRSHTLLTAIYLQTFKGKDGNVQP